MNATQSLISRGDILNVGQVTLKSGNPAESKPANLIGSLNMKVTGHFDDPGDIHATGDVDMIY